MKETFPFGQKIAWKPNQKWIDESNLSAFIKDHNLKDYDDLLRRSTSDYAWFWNDEKRYLETYWSRFKDIWVHGDFAAIDESDLWYILGRSDDTIEAELGKPLKPKEIKFVDTLPKTRNAKVMHRVIRAVYLGKETGDLSSLENPQMINAIKDAF